MKNVVKRPRFFNKDIFYPFQGSLPNAAAANSECYPNRPVPLGVCDPRANRIRRKFRTNHDV